MLKCRVVWCCVEETVELPEEAVRAGESEELARETDDE